MLRFAAQALWMNRVKWMSPERVARIQERRFRRLVRWASDHSPFYRSRYRGLDLDRAPISAFPPVHKRDLMAHFEEVVTDPEARRADIEAFVDQSENEGRYYLGRYVPSHTSGSQGQPMLMIQPKELVELFYVLQVTRGNARRVNVREVIRRFQRPARLAIVTLKRGFYPSATSFMYMPEVARRFVDTLWLSQTDPDVIERLNAFRPTALTGYASVLDALALEQEAGRLQIADGLEQVVNNSEALPERAERRIERAFGVRVMNNYATGECPFLTNACPTDPGAHINEDWAILEVVDDDYRPVPDGQTGSKVLITNLANRALPFIRYEVGDAVTMATEPCRCGSRFRRIASIGGRSSETFWVRDGDRYRQLIPTLFKNTLDHIRELREWQAIQVERNRFVLKVELVPGCAFDEGHFWRILNRELALYGFAGMIELRVEIVPRLESDPNTGKFRRVISLGGVPEAEGAAPRLKADPAQAPAGPRLAVTNRAANPTSTPAP